MRSASLLASPALASSTTGSIRCDRITKSNRQRAYCVLQTYQENPGAWWDVTQGDNQDGCCLKGYKILYLYCTLTSVL